MAEDYYFTIEPKTSRWYLKLWQRFYGRWQSLSKRKRAVIAGSLLLAAIIVNGLAIWYLKQPDKQRPEDDRKLATDWQDEAMGWAKLVIPQRKPAFFSLTADKQSKFGLVPSSAFNLKTLKPVPVEFIRENLSATLPLTITAVSEQEFLLKPKTVLGIDKTLNISLAVDDKQIDGNEFDRNYGWTFQTQGKFRVVSNTPGNEKTEVPVNSGIELVFSQDDYRDPAALIKIEPPITYRLERHGEILAIVPLKPLEPNTIYKVNLKAGLNLESRNDPIKEDYSFSFQTREKEELPLRMNIKENLMQISAAETLLVKVFTSQWKGEKEVDTVVFQFPSQEAFVNSREVVDKLANTWMQYYAEKDQVPTSGLTRVMQVGLKIQNKEEMEYLELPSKLPPGYYLVKFGYENGTKLEQLWLQVSDLTGYVAVGKEETLVWLNHQDGAAATRAVVKARGLPTEWLTNEQGIAVFATPQSFFQVKPSYLSVTSGDSQELVLPVNSLKSQQPPGKKLASDYWSYLYNERRLYKPGDTVNFWGVIKDRATNAPPPRIEIVLGYYYGDDSSPNVVAAVQPQADGTFIGSFKLPESGQEWHQMGIKVNDVWITGSSFQVYPYEKPQFTISVAADKKAVFAGEKVTYTAQAGFFDGSPASFLPLNIYDSDQPSRRDELPTDVNGKLEYIQQTKVQEASWENYHQAYVTFDPGVTQAFVVAGQGNVTVFDHKLHLKTENTQDNNQAQLKLTVNRVDLTSLNAGKSENTIGAAAKNQKVSLQIKRTWWESKEIGTYYDFLQKTTRKAYDYQRREEKLEDTKLVTNDQGMTEYSFTMSAGSSYEVEIALIDEDGRQLIKREYFSYYNNNEYRTGNYPELPYLEIDKKEEVGVGEGLRASVNLSEALYPETEKNRFLFIKAQRGRQVAVVMEGPEHNFSFEQEHIPNIHLGAVVFTGKFYQSVTAPCEWQWHCWGYSYDDWENFEGLMVKYRQEDSQLEVKVETDKSQYLPGGEALINVWLTDKGQGVVGARINMALVDKALEAIGGTREPSIISNLYRTTEHLIYYHYHSHEPAFPLPSGAEGGGGGGGDDRIIFKDTALFTQAVTDGSGKAVFKVKLPDDLTTWMIYTQGVTADLKAGQTVSSLAVSKDFFITSQFPRQILSKDKAFVTGGSFGKLISGGNKVNWEAAFYQNNKELSKKTQQSGTFSQVDIEFPNLAAGSYQLALRGKSGNLSDGIRLPFEVANSRVSFQYQNRRQINAGEKMTSLATGEINTSQLVKLVIADAGKGQFYSELWKYCDDGGNRLESWLGRRVAGLLLEEYFGEKGCQVTNDWLKGYQSNDGSLSKVQWGGGDLPLTTWGAVVQPQVYDQKMMKDFLSSRLSSQYTGSTEKIYAAFGLQQLGEPELIKIRQFLADAKTYKEKVLAALALAYAGETEAALETYYDLLADYGYTFSPYVRIQAELPKDKGIDPYLENTALALLLGSKVDKQFNQGLYLYLRDYRNEAKEVALALAETEFIKEELKKAPPETAKISFVSSTKNFEREIKGKNSSLSISLSATELNNFALEILSGKVEVSEDYYLTSEAFDKLSGDSRLKLSRNYRKVKGDGDKIFPGDVVEVSLDLSVHQSEGPKGSYTVTDHIPSGFTYIGNPGIYNLKSQGYFEEGRTGIIRHTFTNSPWWQRQGLKKVTYYLRASMVGTYQAEPAVIQSRLDRSVFQKTESHFLTVEKSK